MRLFAMVRILIFREKLNDIIAPDVMWFLQWPETYIVIR